MECETLVHLWAALLRDISIMSRFPGDTRARGTPPTGVSLNTGTPLQRSRSVPQPVVLHVLALPRALSTGRDDIPALWQVVGSLFGFTPTPG